MNGMLKGCFLFVIAWPIALGWVIINKAIDFWRDLRR